MKRPYLVHFLAIKTDDFLAIRASVTMKENIVASGADSDLTRARFPIQDFRLLRSDDFGIKIVALNAAHQEIFRKTYDSDSFGNFSFKIPLTPTLKDVQVLQVYEVKKRPGLELNLGTYIPLVISGHKKLVVCDFDKTLVDTRYSSTREMVTSLTRPLEYFPTVHESVKIVKDYIEQDHHPFILSASPHFYEDAMRDWLYKNGIYTAGIFLKDYRKVFSLWEGDLTPKDLKLQGLYKLGHLLDILTMTGIPDELVLMGDNFESDPVIYLTLAKILCDDVDPWALWNKLKNHDLFQLTAKQNGQFLNKMYHLHNMSLRLKNARDKKRPKLTIYIRKKFKDDKVTVPDFWTDKLTLIKSFDAHSNPPELAAHLEADLRQ